MSAARLDGDHRLAAELLSAAAGTLAATDMRDATLKAEARLLGDMVQQALEDDVHRLTKLTTADVHRKSTGAWPDLAAAAAGHVRPLTGHR